MEKKTFKNLNYYEIKKQENICKKKLTKSMWHIL